MNVKTLSRLLVVAFALAQPCGASAAAAEPAADRSPAAPLAGAISTVTGIAVSPLLGTGAYGAYRWATAHDQKEKDALPWYAHWAFFGPALLLVGACAAKDSFGAVIPPGLKKPFDVMELVENKLSGLVAAGAVVPLTMAAASKLIVGAAPGQATVHWVPSGLAMLHFGAINLSWLLDILTIPFGVAMFALVWMASHAINVLILISPWGAIDAALKGARTALLGLLTLTATINPWLGAVLSLLVIVVAYFVAGWAFRLTVFGSVFCWDFFTLRKRRFTPGTTANLVFSGSKLDRVPVRTYGRLVAAPDGAIDFTFRPWLFLPERTVRLPEGRSTLAVGRGLLFSNVCTGDGDAVLLLPPRYRGHEEEFSRIYGLGLGVREAGLLKAWSSLRAMVFGAPAGAGA